MLGELRHRGPDGEGALVDDGAGLAHARLSIIDLAAGAQPMANDDGTVCDHLQRRDLQLRRAARSELIARGHRFRTDSDTEVILHLYEEMGPDCVERLNGDFAFAIWDARRSQLMLARDRMGVRPLFYTRRGGALFFASEVKALLAGAGHRGRARPDRARPDLHVLVPARAAHDLQGHLRAAAGACADRRRRTASRSRRYWELEFPDAADARLRRRAARTRSPKSCATLLIDATRIRLRSDVPVGAYLSGGLDSSIVAAMASGIAPERLRTFSVRFDDPEIRRERVPAGDGARARHRAQRRSLCRAADIGASLSRRDPPRRAADPAHRAGAAVSRSPASCATSGFKVVLTGEGADEVFGGYDIFKEAKLRRFCARQPQLAPPAAAVPRLYPYLPKLQAQSPAYLEGLLRAPTSTRSAIRCSRICRASARPPAPSCSSPASCAQRSRGYDALDDLRASLPADFARWHPLSQAQYLETAYLLPGYILSSQGDRVAMAHAVEGRFPFLDHRVVEFAARIPPR